MVKFLNYLKKMNKKLVNYKYGDDLSKYININNYILKNYNNMNGGEYTFDAKTLKCVESPIGEYITNGACTAANIPSSNTPSNKHVNTDILLKSFQKLTNEMLDYISKSYNPNDPTDRTDYKKIARYLLFNIEVLSQYFPDDSLNELSGQIKSINEIIIQKIQEIGNL